MRSSVRLDLLEDAPHLVLVRQLRMEQRLLRGDLAGLQAAGAVGGSPPAASPARRELTPDQAAVAEGARQQLRLVQGAVLLDQVTNAFSWP